MKVRTFLAVLAGFFVVIPSLHAAEATPLPVVQVTATRQATALETLPAAITIITGDELRARGANDLRTALSLVAGVEGTPGSDSGPAGSSPALWGLREVDAFLLVIDGVPAGGAFNPLTTQVDLTGVERIEVLRGAAPVMYGATSFNGVIHIIHYAPGSTHSSLSAAGGSQGSYGAAFVGDLPGLDSYSQSITANVEKRGFKVDRQDYNRYHLLYRGGSAVGETAHFHLDADLSALRQTPGNVIFRNGASLRTDLLPIDANHNPSDAAIDQNRQQLNLGFDGHDGPRDWAATLSVARTTDKLMRGFLRDYAPSTGNIENLCVGGVPDPSGPDGKCDDFDADGYEQSRKFTEAYFDAHLTQHFGAASLTWGVDYLHGAGKQHAFNYGYYVSLDGSDAPAGAAQHHDEIVRSEDKRDFAGLYAQTDFKLGSTVDVLAGLRLSHTQEDTEGEEILNDMDQMASQGVTTDSRTKARLGGTLGVSWAVFRDGNNHLTVYTDYRNTYKPLAVDFGPEAETAILEPETSDSYELGARGTLLDGRVSYDTSVFQLDFRNLKTRDTLGNTVNAGKTRFRGGEVEVRVGLIEALQLMANYAYHDSRFISFNRDGTPGGVVDGRRLELAPYHLAGAGLIYAPTEGFTASLVSNYTGERRLNKSNSLHAGGFTTYDASLGWNFRRFAVALNGYNLSDRRDPVAESELSEGVSGASSYYMLPGARVMLNLSMPL